MEIILSRHGNTFGPGDPVVWTGSKNDLPLVKKGRQQAEKLAQVLSQRKMKPKAIYCGPLQRTLAYASIVVERLSLPFTPIIDSRLNEIDYGMWTGLTKDQIISKFGEKEFQDWENDSKWPVHGSWGGKESEIIASVHDFIQSEISKFDDNDVVLVVSSNGRLRYFLTLIKDEFEKRVRSCAFKVKTGNVCHLQWRKKSEIQLKQWDVSPEQLLI